MKLIYIGNKLSKNGLTPTSIETLGEKLKEDYLVVQASPIKNSILRLFHMWSVVVRHRTADYLIIDTYSTSAFHFAWTSARIAIFFGIKYVPILRGGNLPDRLRTSRRISEHYLLNAYQIVCPSEYLKEKMQKVVDGNYLIIPNYIDLERYDFKIRTNINPKILWVRAFDAVYNPVLAIKIVYELLKKYPNAELCMVGPDKDGSKKEVEKEVRRLGIEKHVVLIGKLSKKEWCKLSEEYDIFLNTTNFDNTPVSVIEAMALGLPMVSTDVGGLPYLLEDGKDAILTIPNNEKVMSNAIDKLIRKPELTRILTQNARTKVENFDWSKVETAWKELFI